MMRFLNCIVILLFVSTSLLAQEESLLPIFPSHIPFSNADLYMGIVDILQGYGYCHEQQESWHILTWENEAKKVVIRFDLPFSLGDMLRETNLNPVIPVEFDVQNVTSQDFHVHTEYIDFTSAGSIVNIFRIAQAEKTIIVSQEKLYETHLKDITHWRDAVVFHLSYRRFSRKTPGEFQWVYHGANLARWFQVHKSYGIDVKIIEDFSSASVLCKITVVSAEKNSAAIFRISSSQTFFAFESLIEDLVNAQDVEKSFDVMQEVQRGEYYSRMISQYELERTKRLLNIFREFERKLGEPHKWPLRLSELDEYAQQMAIEYMARAFKLQWERNKGLIPDALVEMRTALQCMVDVDESLLEKNIRLRQELIEFLRKNPHVDLSPGQKFLALEEIFKREVFRNIKRMPPP